MSFELQPWQKKAMEEIQKTVSEPIRREGTSYLMTLPNRHIDKDFLDTLVNGENMSRRELEQLSKKQLILCLEGASCNNDELRANLKTAQDHRDELAKLTIELQKEIGVLKADENGLRETIGHLNKALEALNGVTP